MENLIFASGKAASCTLKLDRKPSPDTIEKIKTNKDIVAATLK